MDEWIALDERERTKTNLCEYITCIRGMYREREQTRGVVALYFVQSVGSECDKLAP